MIITSSRIVACAALFTLVAGLAAPVDAHANQGRGELAQYPLSITNIIPPAFIMAVDDSGSMTFETLFPPRDGMAYWDRGTASTNGFFNANGTFRSSGTGNYHHLIPHSGSRYRIGTNRYAIPPIDNFGFARSHQFNPSYFDPSVTYVPWQNADGSYFPNASPTAARVDPRDAAPTINLTVLRRGDRNNQHRFYVGRDTVLPANTVVEAGGNCGGLNSTNWTTLNAARTITANCQIGIEYFPAVFYLTADTPAPPGFITANRIGPIAHAGGPNVSMYKYEIRPANYVGGAGGAAYQTAIRNFANWFTYYGNRSRAMIAGMTQSFADVNTLRVGYFTINVRNNVTMRDMAVAADRSALYNSFLSLPASGSTPNRQAVQHMGQQFQRSGSGAPIQLACQKNAGMLFTDGYSNQDGPSVGNVDGGMGAPFRDGHSNTLADIATSFYLNDAQGRSPLRPAVGPEPLEGGKVPVPDACAADDPDPRLNCQSNLHMQFYGITLGARGNLFDPDVDQDPYGDPAIYNNWPSRQNDNPTTVDDIWHATVNTRGRFINATTPEDITSAMRQILSAVGGGEAPSGSVALSGARVGDGAFTVQPSFESRNEGTDWVGRLTGFELALDDEGNFDFEPIWEAGARLAARTEPRQILFATPNGDGVNPSIAQFTPAGLGAGALARLCSNSPGLSRCSAAEIQALGVNATQVINYLRGDQTLSTAGPLRERSGVLGDIVNSSPAISERGDNYGYRSLRPAPEGSPDPLGYGAYLEAKRDSGRPRMVYVGANDGMLHAFNGETGEEEFAFIPSTAVGHMGNLVFPYNPLAGDDQKFQHTYFVDGQVSVSDFRTATGWGTALVGASGAGGRSVFALNVSNPTSFSASDVLWEITPAAAGTTGSHIGNVLNRPVIVPVRQGTQTRWKAIFGNGFGSSAEVAALYVVDMSTGETTVIPATEPAGSAPDYPNGMAGIVAVDRYDSVSGGSPVPGTDGLADTVYGGDLHGNIWKFDLRDNSVAAEPLFTATDGEGNRQPITGGMEVAAGPGNGVMIYFGTGSFAFQNDGVDSSMQSLYGILDSGSSVGGRENLREQTITASGDVDIRNVSTNSVSFVDLSGWFIDLAVTMDGNQFANGERFVGTPRLSEGTIFFPTFEPGGSDAQSDPCAPGGKNWLYALNALNGGAAMSGLRLGSRDADPLAEGSGAVALTQAGSTPVREVAVALVPQLNTVGPGATAEEIAAALEETCDKVITAAGGFLAYQARACGRQSWRQIR